MDKKKIVYVFETSQLSSIHNMAINKVQTFDTTHSEYLISSLNKLPICKPQALRTRD